MVKKAKPVKKAKQKIKKASAPEKEKLPKARKLVGIVAGTLEANSDGEFDLPSMLTRYLSGPKASIGLHREYYLPVVSRVPYYPSGSERAMMIYRRQAAEVINEIVTGGFAITSHEFDLPFCEECE